MSEVRRAPLWLALLCAVLGGLALDAATPWLAWWWAAPVGVALVLAAVWQQRAVVGLGIGAVAGAAFWGPHISWLTLYLGPIPWLALTGAMLAWFALFGLATAVATRGLSQLPVSPGIRGSAQAVTAAALWVLREQVQSIMPYGGFAWGRLAHTQAEGPWVSLVSWVGFAGLSGVIALASAFLVVAAWSAAAGASSRRLAGFVGAWSVAVLLLAAVPPAALPEIGSLRVAAVQGNSKSGIFDDRESGDVLRDHLRETERLVVDLEASGESVDVIVWPENSAEFDLPGSAYASRAVARLAERANAPIVIGTILRDPDGTYTNSSLVVTPEGVTGERYDKRRPVPFAEYMPDRAFYRALVPDLVDLVQLEYAFGARSAVIEVPVTQPSAAVSLVRAGIAICFDIIFDDHAVEMARDGAQVIFAQTNNADFGRTDESAQQLQIARLRAVEMGRALINISTVGTSAIVAPDGRSLATLTPFTSAAMVADVPLVSGETPALRVGAAVAGIWILLAAVGLAAGALTPLVRRDDRAGT